MRKQLTRLRRRCLYHFTDSRNIISIRARQGLLSLARLEELDVDDIQYGGNQWSHDADRHCGVDRYVHLCFARDHPMEFCARQEGRILNTCWLEIDLNILEVEGVRYTTGVANRAGMPLLTKIEALDQIDFVGLYDWLDFAVEGNRERKLEARKAQILIPELVPIQSIINIQEF